MGQREIELRTQSSLKCMDPTYVIDLYSYPFFLPTLKPSNCYGILVMTVLFLLQTDFLEGKQLRHQKVAPRCSEMGVPWQCKLCSRGEERAHQCILALVGGPVRPSRGHNIVWDDSLWLPSRQLLGPKRRGTVMIQFALYQKYYRLYGQPAIFF